MVKRYRKPYKVRDKKRFPGKHHLRLFLLFFVLAGLILYLFLFSPLLQIKEIRISGDNEISKVLLYNILEKEIGKSVFFINPDAIEKMVLAAYPLIYKAELKRKLPAALQLTIKERHAAAIFSQYEKSFFIDKEGVIFEETLEPNPQLIKIQNFPMGEELMLGEKAVKKEILAIILKAKNAMDGSELSLEEAYIISAERINFKTGWGWQIYLDPRQDLDWQLTKLNLLLDKNPSIKEKAGLQYIDLRFGDKAYYK